MSMTDAGTLAAGGTRHLLQEVLRVRQRAEASLRELPDDFAGLSQANLRQMFHDLRVHQAELEMQNENLRAAELALDTARARYFDFYDLAPVGYLTLDAHGLIEQANLTTAALLGVTRDALLKQPLSRFILKADQDIWYHYRQQLIETRQAQACELRLPKADGAPFWAQLEGIVVPDETGATVLRIVLSDVSERKRAEAELEQHRHHLEALVDARTTALSIAKEAAEAANRTKSTFLANMSHELRTPMNAIIGMTNMALRRATDPKQKNQLGIVTQSANKLLALINEILDIANLESKRLTLAHVAFKLGEVPENLTSLIGHQATVKGLQFVIDMPAALYALSLTGDPRRLDQILFNLVSNAVKFTEAGCVTVRARLIEDNPDTVLLRWEVQDTGIGIALEDQTRIFTPFEQADNSLTRKYGGTGLGLALCKRLAQMMGGTIGVESAPGLGSCFWLTVRLSKAPPDAVPATGHFIAPAPTFDEASAQAQIKACANK